MYKRGLYEFQRLPEHPYSRVRRYKTEISWVGVLVKACFSHKNISRNNSLFHTHFPVILVFVVFESGDTWGLGSNGWKTKHVAYWNLDVVYEKLSRHYGSPQIVSDDQYGNTGMYESYMTYIIRPRKWRTIHDYTHVHDYLERKKREREERVRYECRLRMTYPPLLYVYMWQTEFH